MKNSHSPIGHQIEVAYNRGFQAGYQAGTIHMRRAYGSTLEETGEKKEVPEGTRDDARLSRTVEDLDPVCLHDGQEDASNCPAAEEGFPHIVVARFPPYG